MAFTIFPKSHIYFIFGHFIDSITIFQTMFIFSDIKFICIRPRIQSKAVHLIVLPFSFVLSPIGPGMLACAMNTVILPLPVILPLIPSLASRTILPNIAPYPMFHDKIISFILSIRILKLRMPIRSGTFPTRRRIRFRQRPFGSSSILTVSLFLTTLPIWILAKSRTSWSLWLLLLMILFLNLSSLTYHILSLIWNCLNCLSLISLNRHIRPLFIFIS